MASPARIASVLRAVASNANSPHPVRSESEELVRLAAEVVASSDDKKRSAGIKDIWHKLFKSKGEKKILKQLSKIKELRKALPKLVAKVRSGEDLGKLASDPNYESLFFRIFSGGEPFDGSSEAIEFLNEHIEDHVDKLEDVKGAMADLDGYLEGDEEGDAEDDIRKVFAKRLSELDSKLEGASKKLEKKAADRAAEKKKGKSLDDGKEKKGAKKEPREPKTEESGESDEESDEVKAGAKPKSDEYDAEDLGGGMKDSNKMFPGGDSGASGLDLDDKPKPGKSDADEKALKAEADKSAEIPDLEDYSGAPKKPKEPETIPDEDVKDYSGAPPKPPNKSKFPGAEAVLDEEENKAKDEKSKAKKK